MPIPTFDGVPVFQSWGQVSIVVQDNPRDEQKDAYFGVNGFERKDGGDRGRVARARGRLRGNGYAGLAAAEALFRSYRDGVPRTLVDTLGVAWPAMKLLRFVPEGEAMLGTDGWCSRDYTAEFEAPI